MATRTESSVYLEQDLDLTKALPFIEAFNRASPRRITVFHLFVWAAVKALAARPRLNRFVSGGRIYEREGIWLSYSAKKSLSDDAPIIVIKRKFDPAMSFSAMVESMAGDIGRGRSNEKSHVDKELSILLRLPGPLLALAVKLQRWADAWNLLPGAFIHNDPLYTSLFVANMGSLKMDSPFHHLYEYGNCPLFAAIGRNRTVPVVKEDGQLGTRTICTMRYSFDERVEDGLYCIGSIRMAHKMIEDPLAAGADLPADPESRPMQLAG